MRAVIQRVSRASVTVDGQVVGKIGKGLLVFLGVGPDDTPQKGEELCQKIINLRIFEDMQRKMNLSLPQVEGELLVVSQFTLFADTRKGNRPNFTGAAKPDHANELYRQFIEKSKVTLGPDRVSEGIFGAMMDVDLLNDGPVTICMDNG